MNNDCTFCETAAQTDEVRGVTADDAKTASS